jgi:iron complex transport system permease protein
MNNSPGAPRRLPVPVTILALMIALMSSILLGSFQGDQPLPAGQVTRAILHPVFSFVPAADDVTEGIVLGFRLPRVLLAALVGAALSAVGAALQGILGNPLADPYTMGVSSGASVGAALALLLGWGGLWGGMGLTAFAFGSALLTMILVFALARTGGRLHTASFLLAGIVAGSLLWSLTTLILSLAGQEQGRILNFLMGRFSEASWREVAIAAPFALGSILLFTLCGRSLDAFAFGEDVARSVGIEIERFKAGILALAALTTAVSVSVSGVIGFIGLIVPHAARALVGPPHRGSIPVAALLGAVLAVLADLLARLILPGSELPVGVITALLGAPFFLFLLRRQMNGG